MGKRRILKIKRKARKYEECHKTINNIEYKMCNNCNEWLPCTDEYFYKTKNKTDGLRPDCKECTIKRTTNWREENPEKYQEGYTERNFNFGNEYYREVKQKWEKENEDERVEYKRKWRKNNPAKIKEYSKFRVLHKKHEISKEEWENCKNYFHYKCAYCGLKVEEHFRLYDYKPKQIDLHKEHVNHEGSNDLSNCVPACQSCNSSKRTYTLDEWYNEGNENFTQERLDKIHNWINQDYLKYKE